jgi:L-ribulose-5-phosphate 4-epimerase
MEETELRRRCHAANLELVRLGLVLFTWGNASVIDRERGIVYIKPSGVDYEGMRPEHMVPVRLADGAVVGGDLRPSSDTPTHLVLYRAWSQLGGIVHTHSAAATAVAQMGAPIPALGTTHADYFHGDVPCARPLTKAEIDSEYEANTGHVIIERFAQGSLDPLAIPGVLVNQHAPFAWGRTVEQAAMHAGVLERVADMYLRGLAVGRPRRVPKYLLDRHYLRKHGAKAYYGQGKH